MTKSHGYTGEKTESALLGDSLHGISLCLHPKNSSTCAPPPPGHSQVGVRIQRIPQTDITPYSCQSSERGFGLASSRKSCCSNFTEDYIPPAAKGACPHLHPVTGLGQSLHLSSSHPSSAWYPNLGHHQS